MKFHKILLTFGIGLSFFGIANAAQVPGSRPAMPGYALRPAKPVALDVNSLVEQALEKIQEHPEKLSQLIDLEDPKALAHTIINLQDDFNALQNLPVKLADLRKLLAQRDLPEAYNQITELVMNLKHASMLFPILSSIAQITPAEQPVLLDHLKDKMRALRLIAPALPVDGLVKMLTTNLHPAIQGLLAKLIEAKYTLLLEKNVQKVNGIIQQLDADLKKLRDAKFETIVSSISKLRPADFDVITKKLEVL